jgi:hypothetical protein
MESHAFSRVTDPNWAKTEKLSTNPVCLEIATSRELVSAAIYSPSITEIFTRGRRHARLIRNCRMCDATFASSQQAPDYLYPLSL